MPLLLLEHNTGNLFTLREKQPTRSGRQVALVEDVDGSPLNAWNIVDGNIKGANPEQLVGIYASVTMALVRSRQNIAIRRIPRTSWHILMQCP
jgi:hypothetical protein